MLRRYSAEVQSSGIVYIILGYSVVAAVSIYTMWLGPVNVVYGLSSYVWGGLLSIFVFDSWGTTAGLYGIIVFYAILIFGARDGNRRETSLFLVLSSITNAVVAGLVWDTFFDATTINGVKLIASGASTIALAGEGTIVVLSVIGIVRTVRFRQWKYGGWSKNLTFSWIMLYFTAMLMTLLYVVVIQPAFVQTSGYNWQAHGIAFVLGVISTSVYVAIRPRSNGLRGSVPLDRTLMNARFGDFAVLFRRKYGRGFPLFHVVFKRLQGPRRMECHPELKEIWVADFFGNREYLPVSQDFDMTLLHEMVHVELYRQGGSWRHGEPGVKDRFSQIAQEVSAYPEQ